MVFIRPVTMLLILLFVGFSSGASRSVIVKLKSDTCKFTATKGTVSSNNSSLQRILTEYAVRRSETVFNEKARQEYPEWKRVYRLELPRGKPTDSFINELKKNPAVEWAEPNYALKIYFTPNDSLLQQQWGLFRIGMPQAWEVEMGDSQVIVGVIDTGVDYHHADLQGQFWVNTLEDLNGNGKLDDGDLNGVDDDGNGYTDDVIGWDFTDAPDFPDGGDYLEPDNDPMDEYPGGHGTPVSGIIAAATNNSTGMAGVAPGIRIMALRAGTASGYLEEDDIAEAIVYAVQNGCKIVNMSFGDVVYSHLIKDAVVYGTSQGVLFVASAGNSGNAVLNYPASYDETISVGAANALNNLAPFSSFGSKIDLVAPGNNILSLSVSNEYGMVSGTSFSAPMVSAAAALLWSHFPAATPADIKARLFTGCLDLGHSGWDEFFGHGLLNVYRSLTGEQGGYAEISFPGTQGGVSTDEVAVIGTASGSEMQEFTLSYGPGEMPAVWTRINRGTHHIVQDTVGIWSTASLPDTVYTLELKVATLNGNTFVDRVIVYLDRTAPIMDSLQILPVVVENEPGYLVLFYTDDPTVANLYYRNTGVATFTHSLTSGYFSHRHNLLLTREQITGQVEFYLELENSAGLTSIIDNNGLYFQLDLTEPLPLREDFRKIDEIAGFGYFHPRVHDFDGDGTPELVAYAVWPDFPDARLNLLNYQNGQFTRFMAPVPAFPRDVLDVDGDNRAEILAGYGETSYLFPGTTLPQFSNPVSAPVSDFWAARWADVDGDGSIELFAIHRKQWRVYRLTNPANFTVTEKQVLENSTTGANEYGVPYLEIADLDNDGRPELILGDYDGDLLIYELTQAGRFEPVFQKKLPGEDATHCFAVGDFDGDSLVELAVATQTLSRNAGEFDVRRQYWTLTVLKSNGDNSLQEIWQQHFYGVTNQKNIFSGITAADYDGDGRDEIFFTPYPRAYYIQYEDNRFVIDWFYHGVNCNAVPLMETNRWLLTGDSTLMVWQRESAGQRPLPPSRLWVESADTLHIRLAWTSVTGASAYLLNRQHPDSVTVKTFPTTQPFFIDSTVQQNVLYTYSVQTVDSSFAIPLSQPGRIIRVRAENPPQFESLTRVSPSQLLIKFTRPLGEDSYTNGHFLLLPESLHPLSAVRGQGRTQVLLSFSAPFPPGRHLLIVSDLNSYQGVPIYRDSLLVPFQVIGDREAPYLEKVEMLSKTHLVLYFNHPMEKESAENPENYSLYPDDRVVTARLDTATAMRVHLYLTGKNRMGGLGVNYYLEVRRLKDVWGVELQTDLKSRYLIQQKVEALGEVIVYPNPFRKSFRQNEIVFGKIPNGCEIFIYTASGKMVRHLKETDFNGGVNWDLRNEAGREVGSGVYLYIARFGEQEKMGKFVILK